MAQVKLAFGYDDERPYGQLADTEAGLDLRRRNLFFVRKLMEFFDSKKLPRTFFILGQYLDRCLDTFSKQQLREIYVYGRYMCELQQHSYSHPLIKPLPGYSKQILSAEEFAQDVQRAKKIIQEVLGRTTIGIRIPNGYTTGLHDAMEVAKRLSELGFVYVSSMLKGSGESLQAELTLERQPHLYEIPGSRNIVEIPSHGWQDVIFTKEKAQALLGSEPAEPDEIKNHFTDLLRKGLELSRVQPRPVYICLCLHPWAAMEYDPELDIHKHIVEEATRLHIEIVTYGHIAAEVSGTHTGDNQWAAS